MRLPPLRQELSLLPGPSLTDGQPSWTLHDPTRQLFYRIDWPTFEVLKRWSLGDSAAIAQDIKQNTLLAMSVQEVDQVVDFLLQNQLLQQPQSGHAREMDLRWQAMHPRGWHWLVHHYLFFRIPMLNPDDWLTRTLPWVRPLMSWKFAQITLVAWICGLYIVGRQMDQFTSAVIDTLSWNGLASYGVALITVKVLHELGHAFACKQLGCKVPTMGVAFLVMWPVAYTDTNDSWRLTNRWHRLTVASAGILTELTVAIWATLAWGLSPEGSLKSAMLFLATTSWYTTLLINASPFMRFDGYFILSDALDMPNLHARSFQLARWKLREWLFGLNHEPPEYFSPNKQRALIAFAWLTWLYRLALFLTIAALVYNLFFKFLGLGLFLIEIVWFVLLPIYGEIKQWIRLWPEIRLQRTLRRSLVLTVGLVTACLLPWPSQVHVSAMLHPGEIWPIYAPAGARIEALPYANNEWVNKDDILVTLYMPELQARQARTQARLEQHQWQAETAGMDHGSKRHMQVAQKVLATTQAEMQGILSEKNLYQPVAPFAGRLRDMDPDLQLGQWIGRRERIALLIASDGPWTVETWLEEDDLQRIRLGQRAWFVIDSGSGGMVRLKVIGIDQDATRQLPRPELAAAMGGHVLTREKQGQFFPQRAVYRVTLVNTDPLPGIGIQSWRGKLTIEGNWESPLWHYVRQALAILIRESGL